jgi:hypothetical protein
MATALALMLSLFLQTTAADLPPVLIPALPPEQTPPGFLNGVAAATAPADPAALLAPQLQALDAARARLEHAALKTPQLAGLAAQMGLLRSRLARLPAAWGLVEGSDGEGGGVVDFGALLPPPPPPPNNNTTVSAAWGPLLGDGHPELPSLMPSFSSFQDAALICKSDLFECWRRFGPAKGGALKAALQAEAVRGVEAAADKRARQLQGALDWAAVAAATKERQRHGGNASYSAAPRQHHPLAAAKKQQRAHQLLDGLLGPSADAALDTAVGALAALAAGDAVLAFGEAQAAAAVRVASLLLPVRIALNPRAVVGQTLQLAFDAARTGFRPAMLFPFLTDGRVNNFQELVGFSAQTAVDAVTSGLNAVIAGFDRAARRWWRANSGFGGGGKGGAGDAALAALASGSGGGAALRALLLEGGGGGIGGNGTAAAAGLVERVVAAAAAAAATTAPAAGNATAATAPQQPLPPALSALILRATAAADNPSSSSSRQPRPLGDELKATLGVAGDLFVEWARASARDLQSAAAALDAALPGPSPAEAIRRARRSLERRANTTRAALERAFPSKDVLEAADVLRAASDEILAAAEQAAAVAVSPNAAGVVAARDALAGMAKGMRLASRPLALVADTAFRSPPFFVNATLAAVRALAQEGADEVDAAAKRVRADFGGPNGTLALLAPEAVVAAARRAADRTLQGAADAAGGLLAVAGRGGGGQQQRARGAAATAAAEALSAGLPGAMEPLVRSIAAAVSVRRRGGSSGNAESPTPTPAAAFEGERRAWEEAARALDARAGGTLRDLASRVAALAEAVPVAAETMIGGGDEEADQQQQQPDGGGALPQDAQPQQQRQQTPSNVAIAAALLEAAASGRVASARGAMQGALLRLNARNLEADAKAADDKARTEAAQAAVASIASATSTFVAARPGVAAAARRLRAGGGGGERAAAADGDNSGRPSLAARATVVLSRYGERAVEASRLALSRGAEASLIAQARAAATLRRAAAGGTSAASALAVAARENAPAAAALARRAREAADVFSRGVTDSLSPVVTEGVRMGERIVRGWIDAVAGVVAAGRR